MCMLVEMSILKHTSANCILFKYFYYFYFCVKLKNQLSRQVDLRGQIYNTDLSTRYTFFFFPI